jgi:hypothetical protein
MLLPDPNPGATADTISKYHIARNLTTVGSAYSRPKIDVVSINALSVFLGLSLL